MVKKNESASISTDIDFIKEFEELKIRQKLLIDTLKKKNLSVQNDLFNDINSKLDFLIKIFNEANDSDSSEEQQNAINERFDQIDSKIESVLSNMNGKFEEITTLVGGVKSQLKNNSSPNPSPLQPAVSENGEKSNLDKKEESSNASSENSTESAAAPQPDFKVEDKIEEVSNEDTAKKKKRWF